MTAAQTPEEINAELLGRIVGLERQVVELSARAGVGRPQLPNDDEIRRVGYAAHQALRKVADNADAEQLASDFQRVFEALVAATRR
jgi:hypothetical protein